MTDKTGEKANALDNSPAQAETPESHPEERYCADCGAYPVDDDHTCPEPPKPYDTFLISTRTPYSPPRLDCCSDAFVTVLADPDGRGPGDILIEHQHSTTCEIWRYVP